MARNQSKKVDILMAKSTRQEETAKKITFSIPLKSLERLQNIAEIIEAVTMSEVLRNALRYYETAVLAKESGADVFIREPGGREISIFSR